MDTADQYAPTASRYLHCAASEAASATSEFNLSPRPRTIASCHTEAHDLFRLRYNQWLNDRMMAAAFNTLTQNVEHGTCWTLTWDTSLPKKLSQLIIRGVNKIILSLRDQKRQHWIGVFIEGDVKKCHIYNSFLTAIRPPIDAKRSRKRQLIDTKPNSHPELSDVGGYRLQGDKIPKYLPPTFIDAEPPSDDVVTIDQDTTSQDDDTEMSSDHFNEDDETEIADEPDSVISDKSSNDRRPQDSVRLSQMSINRLDTTGAYSANDGNDADDYDHAEFKCPANAYLERECPMTFTDVDEARKHCTNFHSVLLHTDPACDCAIN